MLMFNGVISITSDFNLIGNILSSQNSSNYKIIILDEGDNNLTRYPNVVMGSILLPPYEALSCLIDGDINNFRIIYTDYLKSHDVDNFIALIMGCFYANSNIIFYNPTENDLGWDAVLLEFFQRMYGITIGSSQYRFRFDPNVILMILDKIYLYNIITVKDYLLSAPAFTGNNAVIQKICGELQISRPRDIALYRKRLLDNIQQQKPKRISLFKKVEEQEENTNETNIPF